MSHLWEVSELVNNDSVGVLKENEDGLRFLDDESIRRYKNRIYKNLDDKAKDKIIKTAKSDIWNIINAMDSIQQQTLLYRTVRVGDIFSEYRVNDIIDFKIISSTSTTPFMEDSGKDFYRYEVIVPKNSLVLDLNQFPPFIRNEDNEVLLPPMKCKIIDIYNNDNINCKAIIKMEYIEQLSPNI